MSPDTLPLVPQQQVSACVFFSPEAQPTFEPLNFISRISCLCNQDNCEKCCPHGFALFDCDPDDDSVCSEDSDQENDDGEKRACKHSLTKEYFGMKLCIGCRGYLDGAPILNETLRILLEYENWETTLQDWSNLVGEEFEQEKTRRKQKAAEEKAAKKAAKKAKRDKIIRKLLGLFCISVSAQPLKTPSQIFID